MIEFVRFNFALPNQFSHWGENGLIANVLSPVFADTLFEADISAVEEAVIHGFAQGWQNCLNCDFCDFYDDADLD